MLRGDHPISRCGVMVLICAATVFGYGEYASQIISPVEPFALTYVPATQHLIVAQFIDGQAGRYRVGSVADIGKLEPMFSPVAGESVAGIAWCETEEVLYWLAETEMAQGRQYQLLRTNIDGWSLPPGPELDLPQDMVLGDITYVPEQDAFWTLDVKQDLYFSIDRTTGEMNEATFLSPVRHPDAGMAYGLGLTYVPIGAGYLDLLIGTLTDQRAMRVVRVDFGGNPVGASYTIDISDQSLRPGWPTGIAYAATPPFHFTAIADAARRKLLLFATLEPAALGVTNVAATVQEKEIGGGQEQESIAAQFTWQNNGAYTSVLLEYMDPMTGEFTTVDSVSEGVEQAAHELGVEGVATYRLAASIMGEESPAATIHLRTVAGSAVTRTGLGTQALPSEPFAVTHVEEPELVIFVAEVRAHSGQAAAMVHRLRRGATQGELEALPPIIAPFPNDYLTIGLAYQSDTQELVWMGYSPQRTYVLARTSTEGAVVATGIPLLQNPFLQTDLGDIAYDSATGTFWCVSPEHNEMFEFAAVPEADPPLFRATGSRITLPTSLPGERGSWGEAWGLSIAPALAEGESIFYVGMGITAKDPAYPALGTNFVKRLVSVVRHGETGSLAAGKPVDLELSTGSALLRGLAVSAAAEGSVFVAAQDIGYLYELRTLGEGPLFARGDANADGTINVADAVFTLEYLFQGGTIPGCLDAADANDTGAVNISDALTLLRHVFVATSSPVVDVPFGTCGTDPTADAVSCVSYPACGS